MANAEDYLDDLLSSVSGVRQEVSQAYNQTQQQRQRQFEVRNRILADEDFMEASGLNSYEPIVTKHTNLRKALSEDDFLRSFEEELDSEDADDFLREFEREFDMEMSASSSKKSANADEAEDSYESLSLMESIDRKVDAAREEIYNTEAWMPTEEERAKSDHPYTP